MKKLHTDIQVIQIGNHVVCDVCNDDYIDSNESGGFLFGSHAYCPKCAAKNIEAIRTYGEEGYIEEWCPPDMSFRDWVLQLRGGDNTIKIISKELR